MDAPMEVFAWRETHDDCPMPSGGGGGRGVYKSVRKSLFFTDTKQFVLVFLTDIRFLAAFLWRKLSILWVPPPRNQLGTLIRWPSANTAIQRGVAPLSSLPSPTSMLCNLCVKVLIDTNITTTTVLRLPQYYPPASTKKNFQAENLPKTHSKKFILAFRQLPMTHKKCSSKACDPETVLVPKGAYDIIDMYTYCAFLLHSLKGGH